MGCSLREHVAAKENNKTARLHPSGSSPASRNGPADVTIARFSVRSRRVAVALRSDATPEPNRGRLLSQGDTDRQRPSKAVRCTQFNLFRPELRTAQGRKQ